MLSASSIKTYLDCPRKYEWQNKYRIRPVQKSTALRFGTAYHLCHQLITQGVEWDTVIERVVSETATSVEAHQVLRLAAEHRRYHEPLIITETELYFQHENYHGYVDFRGSDFIGEYKTTSEDISPGSLYWRRLRIDTQVNMYAAAMSVNRVVYDVTRKPTIKQKKNETVDEYGERLTDDIRSRPEYYFRRETLIVDADISDVEKTSVLISLDVFPKNTSSCNRFGECAYFSLCSNNVLPSADVPPGFTTDERKSHDKTSTSTADTDADTAAENG